MIEKYSISKDKKYYNVAEFIRDYAAKNFPGRRCRVASTQCSKTIYHSGAIGKVFSIESRVHGSRGIPGEWRGIRKYGGGMLYDWGIHIIDQACMVLGYVVKSVRCNFDHITNDEVDDGLQLWI